ncbi:uncharacterized protein [Triticum aestivum]|uniref:uncharacterized protein isoform X2 n=1 Tax=Triticum aestivum TaxID=4565 RepID=UPI001D00E2A7|nr:uncharacterized protein LOC123080625 isoform X2 [Triticum aestivum]
MVGPLLPRIILSAFGDAEMRRVRESERERRGVTVEWISQGGLRRPPAPGGPRAQGSFILPATGDLLAGEYVQRPEEAPAGEGVGSCRADEYMKLSL